MNKFIARSFGRTLSVSIIEGETPSSLIQLTQANGGAMSLTAPEFAWLVDVAGELVRRDLASLAPAGPAPEPPSDAGPLALS